MNRIEKRIAEYPMCLGTFYDDEVCETCEWRIECEQNDLRYFLKRAKK